MQFVGDEVVRFFYGDFLEAGGRLIENGFVGAFANGRRSEVNRDLGRIWWSISRTGDLQPTGRGCKVCAAGDFMLFDSLFTFFVAYDGNTN